MKKLILLVVLGLFTMTVYQSCTQEEVYMDEQIEVSADIQKEGGTGEDIEPWDDDSAGGWTTFCTYREAYGGKNHAVKTDGLYYRCWRSGDIRHHWTGQTRTDANYHCRTGR